MGRKDKRLQQPLEIRVPSFFRCPISLDVMRSPVSLCTGVTYDRASIQRWLEAGHTTCPATRLPLPSTDLVPNLTLHRLIQLWAHHQHPLAVSGDKRSFPSSASVDDGRRDLAGDLRSAADPVPPLRRIADFLAADDADDFEKNSLVSASEFASALASVLKSKKLETLEAVVRVLALILTSDSIEAGNKKLTVSSLTSDLDPSVSALIEVLKDGSGVESRIDAARVLDSIIATSDQESNNSIAEKPDLFPSLILLIGPSDDKGTMDRGAIEAGLACLVGVIAGVRRARTRLVAAGAVPAAVRILMADPAVAPAVAAGRAMRVLEVSAGCAEGRAAIAGDGEDSPASVAVAAILGRMTKAGRDGAEAAVVALWMVCVRFPDRRAVEALAAAAGEGMGKVLLVMQSGCSLAVRQKAADLLKIFRVNAKNCGGIISGYDSKTTHIMPF